MGQQEMNQLIAQWYPLWDDGLNSLWSRLSDELDAETKAKVLEEQRAWIKRKKWFFLKRQTVVLMGFPCDRLDSFLHV